MVLYEKMLWASQPPSTPGATSVTPIAICEVRVPSATVSINISQPTSNINTLSTIGSSPFIATPVISSINGLRDKLQDNVLVAALQET